MASQEPGLEKYLPLWDVIMSFGPLWIVGLLVVCHRSQTKCVQGGSKIVVDFCTGLRI